MDEGDWSYEAVTAPTAEEIRRDHDRAIDEIVVAIQGYAENAKTSGPHRAIYKACTAGQISFGALCRPPHDSELLLKAAGGLIRRVAILCSIRQYSLSRVELRRLIECSIWRIYFCDHPVEWSEFRRSPTRTYDERNKDPIAAAASNMASFYFAYAKERFTGPTCIVGLNAITLLKSYYGALSGDVHAAMGAVHPTGSFALAVDSSDPHDLNQLAKDTRNIIKCCLAASLCADRTLVARIDADAIDWFDWLLNSLAADVRSPNFGVAR